MFIESKDMFEHGVKTKPYAITLLVKEKVKIINIDCITIAAFSGKQIKEKT